MLVNQFRLQLLFLILLFQFSDLLSQDTTNHNPQQISVKGWTWRLNGQKIKPSEAKSEIYSVPDAAIYFKKYRRQTFTGLSLIVTGLVLSKIAIDKKSNSYYTKDYWGLKISSAGCFVSGMILLFSTTKNRNKAIRVYNESGIK
jgi:hypothetical protein